MVLIGKCRGNIYDSIEQKKELEGRLHNQYHTEAKDLR